MKLTNTACMNAKGQQKPYKKFDGGGLYLEVMPNGHKLWRLKYRYLGKEKRISLGAYPLISLAEARENRDEAKKLLARDIDPSTAKRDRKRQVIRNAENTFEAVAREWHGNQLERWSEDYGQKVMHSLEMNAFPYIGNRPISQITPPELLECLRRIEKRGAFDIAGRTKQICSQIFRYGIQTGKCDRDAAADLKGALKARKAKHFAAIDAKDIPAFIKTLDRNDARLYGRTQRAIRLSMLTFCRPGEIRQACWSEIDFEAKQWIIPAEKNEDAPRPHRAVEQAGTGYPEGATGRETGNLNTDYVFPSQIRPKQPMSDGTVNKGIKRLGYGEGMVAHGFRALARTTIREKLGYDSEVIEKQLAHKTSNPLGEAYDRTQFLDKRKKMMQEWADFLDAVASNGKVVQGKFRKMA